MTENDLKEFRQSLSVIPDHPDAKPPVRLQRPGSPACCAMAEAIWKTMREREMTLEDVLNVCSMLVVGVGKHGPAANDELVARLEDKLWRLRPGNGGLTDGVEGQRP